MSKIVAISGTDCGCGMTPNGSVSPGVILAWGAVIGTVALIFYATVRGRKAA